MKLDAGLRYGDIVLHCADATLSISLTGAEPRSWRIGDTDFLWEPDAKAWNECAPLLFPVVGWTRDGVRIHGRNYPLGLHGFARFCRFQPIEILEASARLRLRDNAQTRAVYPFSFQLDVVFRLSEYGFEQRVEILNLDDEPLPYAVGFHPGFCWPLAGSRSPCVFAFEQPENPDVPVITSAGLFGAQKRRTCLKDGRLELTAEDFAAEALCFLNIRSRKFYYDNGENLRLAFALDDFDHIALWALPPAPFLCIEAWTGYGDPENFNGEIFDKPSMRILKPCQNAEHGVSVLVQTRADGCG